MKTSSTVVAAFLLLIVAILAMRPEGVAQTPTADTPKADPKKLSEEDNRAVRKALKDYEGAWNTHDMKALDKLHRDDAEFINVVGMHWHGREAINKAHTIFDKIMFHDTRLKTDSIQTRALGADYAIAVWVCTLDSYKTPDGHVVPKGQSRLSLVMGKGSDGWKIVHGHNVRIDAEAAKNDPINGPKK
jgi:uncharacterized protein (TIGR02246 family)